MTRKEWSTSEEIGSSKNQKPIKDIFKTVWDLPDNWVLPESKSAMKKKQRKPKRPLTDKEQVDLIEAPPAKKMKMAKKQLSTAFIALIDEEKEEHPEVQKYCANLKKIIPQFIDEQQQLFDFWSNKKNKTHKGKKTRDSQTKTKGNKNATSKKKNKQNDNKNTNEIEKENKDTDMDAAAKPNSTEIES